MKNKILASIAALALSAAAAASISHARPQTPAAGRCAALTALLKEYGRQLQDAAHSQASMAISLQDRSSRVQMACEFDRPGIERYLQEASRAANDQARTSARIAEALAAADCR